MKYNVCMAVPETLTKILSKHGFEYDNRQDFVEWLNSIPSDLTETVNVHDLTEDTAKALCKTVDATNEYNANFALLILSSSVVIGGVATLGYWYWKIAHHKPNKSDESTEE